MNIMMILMILISMLSILMMMICNIISKKSFFDREKNSPFECGFDPKNSARLPFSLHFFLIAMIFLIFDVEITLILPFIMSMKTTNLINFLILLTFFLIILVVGILHEWKQGALNWI